MLPEIGASALMGIAAAGLYRDGRRDVPVLLLKVGKFMAQMRRRAAEFRQSFDEVARQSELAELRH